MLNKLFLIAALTIGMVSFTGSEAKARCVGCGQRPVARRVVRRSGQFLVRLWGAERRQARRSRRHHG